MMRNRVNCRNQKFLATTIGQVLGKKGKSFMREVFAFKDGHVYSVFCGLKFAF